jgi:AcrR family transcriptional regulator
VSARAKSAPATTKPKPNREEKKAATREALLEAAMRVFARQGYVATSVDEVAWEAGMTKGAVYSNFASKEELFAAVVERHQDQRLLALARSVDRDAPIEEQTAVAGEAFNTAIDRDFVLLGLEYTLHAARFPNGHEPMRQRNRRMREAIAEIIQETGPDDFPVQALPIHELVLAFFAIGDGVSLQRLIHGDDFPDDLYGKVLAIFIRGLEATAEDQGKLKRPARRAPARRPAD